MEREFIEITKFASKECEDFLLEENYKINDFLRFNIFSYTYSIHRMQLKYMEAKISRFNFDEMKLNKLYSDEIENQLKFLQPRLKQLNSQFDLGNHLIRVSTQTFVSEIDGYLDHKGLLMGSFLDFCNELENEFRKVITSYKNFGQGKGKLTIPYNAYISFFKYPLVFLDRDFDHSDISSIFNDFQNETFDFTTAYCKLSTHIQNCLTLENALILKNNGIKVA
ncbi:hypothetical protein LB467_12715 [Salegentibacter sp. JZCK2]|uniref:hypothetical protein n=1 Tax=Salegentibacter tibetensis TaxID=2873600 RepID=UPI001CCE0D20|nr:hypothetical protein [Salegentibacter tibetensis]MBZ9730549.1 hypothetical protein [Salegentibacter tibetensis]